LTYLFKNLPKYVQDILSEFVVRQANWDVAA